MPTYVAVDPAVSESAMTIALPRVRSELSHNDVEMLEADEGYVQHEVGTAAPSIDSRDFRLAGQARTVETDL
jgi:PhoPQ-activated pathogenicity-related protein